jgi:septation ring formation regulator EzrA
VVLLLEVRRLSQVCAGFLKQADQRLAAANEDLRANREAWERLAQRLEDASEPLAEAGATFRTLRESVTDLRDRYQEGASSAARQMGWAVEALKLLRPLFRPKAHPASTP